MEAYSPSGRVEREAWGGVTGRSGESGETGEAWVDTTEEAARVTIETSTTRAAIAAAEPPQAEKAREEEKSAELVAPENSTVNEPYR